MIKELNRQFNRVFVTGDIHGDMTDLADRVEYIGSSTKDDLLIILGDCAFFYSVFFDKPENDRARRKFAAALPVTILCLQGNHEQPFKEMAADKIRLLGGDGYHADGIYFAANGTTLNINGRTAHVVGGAYSVDKPWRLARGSGWWENEELSEAELDSIYNNAKGKHFDFILTHTCPYNFLPREVFLPGIDQSQVSHCTEHALQKIHDETTFDHWYCGHFHTDKLDGKVEFFYYDVKQIM